MPRQFKNVANDVYSWNKTNKWQFHGGRRRSLRNHPKLVGNTSANVGSGNLTVSSHASSLAGDLLVAQITYRNGSTPGTPAGWTWNYLADYLTGEWYGQGYAVLTSAAQTFTMGGSGYKAYAGYTFRYLKNELVAKSKYAGNGMTDIAAIRRGDLIFVGASAAYTANDFVFPYGEWPVTHYSSNGDNTPTTIGFKFAHEDGEDLGAWRTGPWGTTPGGAAQTMVSVWR